MPAVAAVKVANFDQRNTVTLVSAYGDVQDKIEIHPGTDLALDTADGVVHLTGLNTICRYIADLSARKEELLGAVDTAKSQVAEWLSLRNTSLSPITEEKLLKISNHLLTRTFLVQNTLSLADLCLFASLHRAVVALPAAQTDRYCNLIRWFDHIQHTADTSDIFQKVVFRKEALPALPTSILKAKEGDSKQRIAGSAQAAEGPTSSTVVPEGTPDAATTGPPQSKVQDAAPASRSAVVQEPGPESDGISAEAAKDAKKAKKDARKAAKNEATPNEQEARIDMLDIRVGKIVEVAAHPNADALYIEQVDVGDDKPRQVVSGLRNFVSMEQMQERRVVVCTNLKPAKMRDVMSYGLVLCASNATHDKVDPLVPPAEAPLGERIMLSGFTDEPLAEINPKKKILEKLKEDLQTDATGIATYKSIPFMCASGPCTTSIPGGTVG